MKENYWNQFMASGRIDDYLRFKMHEKNSGEQEASRGKEQRESDRTYRYGSLDHAHQRI